MGCTQVWRYLRWKMALQAPIDILPILNSESAESRQVLKHNDPDLGEKALMDNIDNSMDID